MPTQPRKPRSTTAKKADPTPSAPAKAKKRRSTPTTPDQASPAALTVVQGGGEDKYAPTVWGSQEGVHGPQDLELPSGQLVLARKPGVQQLMVEGVLHRMDNLTALVDKKHVRKGKAAASESINVQSLIQDPEALANILHTVDRVLCAVVIRPPIQMAPNDVTSRKNGVIYTDTVGIEDKMFLFNWALGGSKDIERFRRESSEVVGSVVPGEPVADASE